MRQTILNEAPFQVLTTAFSIGPSQTGYDLQISADGVNFSTLFSVPADTTRMITNVARGSTYRCLGNDGEIVVNWVRDCSDGEGGGGGGTGPQGPMGPAGPQGPQGPAGEGHDYPIADANVFSYIDEYPSVPYCYLYLADTAENMLAEINYVSGSAWSLVSANAIPAGIYKIIGGTDRPEPSYVFPVDASGNTNIYATEAFDEIDLSIAGSNPNNYFNYTLHTIPIENDSHLLKSSLDIPEDAELGDVFSIYTSGTPAQYGSAWTDTQQTTIDFAGTPVQAVRVRAYYDGYFDFGFNDSDWHDGMHFYVENGGTTLRSTDDSSRVEAVSNSELKFIAPEWYPTKHNGATMHVKLDNGYLYIWSDDVNQLWINDIAQNNLGGTTETGEIVSEVPSEMGTYQAIVGEVYIVEVDFPNGADRGTYWDSSDMTITINEWPEKGVFTRVVNTEYWGSHYYFEVADVDNQLITIYDDNDDKVAAIVDGDSGTINLGVDFSYTFSGGVFAISSVYSDILIWENIVDITKAGGIGKRRLMYADEADFQKILPKGDNDQDLIAWNGYSNSWEVQKSGNILNDQLRGFGNYNNGQEAIVRTGYWDLDWAPVVVSSDTQHIVKISQSDYDTLVQNDEVDEHTLYLIVENNQ